MLPKWCVMYGVALTFLMDSTMQLAFFLKQFPLNLPSHTQNSFFNITPELLKEKEKKGDLCSKKSVSKKKIKQLQRKFIWLINFQRTSDALQKCLQGIKARREVS